MEHGSIDPVIALRPFEAVSPFQDFTLEKIDAQVRDNVFAGSPFPFVDSRDPLSGKDDFLVEFGRLGNLPLAAE